MEKINLNNKYLQNQYSATQDESKCTCYACSFCVYCLIFPPVVGIYLSVTLGPILARIQA